MAERHEDSTRNGHTEGLSKTALNFVHCACKSDLGLSGLFPQFAALTLTTRPSSWQSASEFAGMM